MKSLRFTRKQNEWKFSAEKLPKLAEQRAGSKRRRQRWRQQHRSEQKKMDCTSSHFHFLRMLNIMHLL